MDIIMPKSFVLLVVLLALHQNVKDAGHFFRKLHFLQVEEHEPDDI
jgi:hypothetical protein